ncbi:hypothetical protein D3C84_961760 [compost metagenome]
MAPMPICRVPPSRTSVLACRPMKWSWVVTGMFGVENNRVLSALSISRSKSSRGSSEAPGMYGSSVCTWPSTRMVSPAARRRAIIGNRSRVMSGLQLRLRWPGCAGSSATSCATRFKPLALISRAAWL